MLLQVTCCLGLLICSTYGQLIGGKSNYTPDGANDIAVPTLTEAIQGERDGLTSVKFIGGTVQVVSGVSYELSFETTDAAGNVEICSAKLWYREWMEPKEDAKQVSDITCGVPRSALDEIERAGNGRSNNYQWATVASEPKLEKEGNGYKVTNVLLTPTSCNRDTARQYLGTGAFAETCPLAANARPLMKCTATIGWSSRYLSVRPTGMPRCGNAYSEPQDIGNAIF